MADKEQELERLQEEKQALITSLQAQASIDNANEAIAPLKEQIERLSEVINKKDEELAQLSQVKSQLETQLDQLETAKEESVAQLEAQLLDIMTKSQALEHENTELKRDIEVCSRRPLCSFVNLAN